MFDSLISASFRLKIRSADPISLFISGVIHGQEPVFVNRVMLDHTAIDLVLLTLGERIVEMFVIVRIMLFATARMEHVLVLLGILVKSKTNRIFFFTQNTSA